MALSKGKLVRISIVVLILVAVMAGSALSVFASDTDNCWGVVTSQRAQFDGKDLGQHSATQAVPRSGLGNVADSFGLSVGELGAFLASVDMIDETECGS